MALANELPSRVLAVDVLRGFDMLWIIGVDRIVLQAATMFEGPRAESLARQMHHSFVDGMTRGFTFYDLILPLFIFLVGVSIPFSLGKRMADGTPRRQILVRVLRRGAILILFGFIYNGILDFDWDGQRYWSVLGRIGITYALAAIVYLYGGLRTTLIAGCLLLVVYGLVLCCVATPGHLPGDFTRDGNIVGYIDRSLLPAWLYPHGLDAEGPFSTLCATANVIMGIAAGEVLRSSSSDCRKAGYLAASAAALLLLGWTISPVLPVMKDLWTTTYALVAGGWSLLLLSASYVMFDILKWHRLGFVFAVVGANAITAYMGYRIVDFNGISWFFFGGIGRQVAATEAGQQLVILLGVVLIQWLILLVLYRHRIFLRV